jgi:hypothetical protein
MAKALITTPFPSTAEVARKLGLAASRIRRVAELMNLRPEETDSDPLTRGRPRSTKRSRAKGAKPNGKIRQKR